MSVVSEFRKHLKSNPEGAKFLMPGTKNEVLLDLDGDGKIWCVYDRDRLKAGDILLVGITEDEILAGGVLPPERRIVISHLDPH